MVGSGVGRRRRLTVEWHVSRLHAVRLAGWVLGGGGIEGRDVTQIEPKESRRRRWKNDARATQKGMLPMNMRMQCQSNYVTGKCSQPASNRPHVMCVEEKEEKKKEFIGQFIETAFSLTHDHTAENKEQKDFRGFKSSGEFLHTICS